MWQEILAFRTQAFWYVWYGTIADFVHDGELVVKLMPWSLVDSNEFGSIMSKHENKSFLKSIDNFLNCHIEGGKHPSEHCTATDSLTNTTIPSTNRHLNEMWLFYFFLDCVGYQQHFHFNLVAINNLCFDFMHACIMIKYWTVKKYEVFL